VTGDAGTRSARKRTRLESDARRKQILDAARHVLSTRPYSEVSMSDLADAAGVARGLLHHYFGSKRDLYLALVRDTVRVPTIPVPTDDPERRALQVWDVSVDRWLQMVDDNRELWLAADKARGIGHDPEVEAIVDESKEVIAEQALAAIGIDDPTPTTRALMRGFGGLVEELTREWLVRERLTREQVRVILSGSLPLLVRDVLPSVVGKPPTAG
jgi:AcrR family transcriptional regulator